MQARLARDMEPTAAPSDSGADSGADSGPGADVRARTRLERITRWVAVAGFGASLVLWLLEAAGRFESHALARVAVAATALAVILAIVLWLIRAWRVGGVERRRRLALALVLALALAIRFAGLDFELMDHPVGDEGVYHEVSEAINQGELLPKTFNYGHFLYYAGAYAMWLRELFPEGLTKLYGTIYTIPEGYALQRLLLKSVNALLAALAAGAVFGAAYRIGGSAATKLAAGLLAGLLSVFSALYNSVAHQAISDVAAGAFAAFVLYFAARLVERESLRDYLLAGVMAGLAAGSKYPGGVSALAIVAVWLFWRLRTRRFSWSLGLAALASIGAMLAVMPALVLRSGSAFSGEGLDIFFGYRQYARGGWLGVQPESIPAWYAREVAIDLGWPALAAAVAGVFCLTKPERRRWMVLAAFPLGYLALIASMSMVVHRNLQPALPGVALLGASAVAALATRLGSRGGVGKEPAAASRTARGTLVWLALGGVVLAMPVVRTVGWDISRSRPGTRQLARAWIEENVPEGATLIRERYTSKLDPKKYAFISHRFAAWQDPEEMLEPRYDYLLLARPAYLRFVELGDGAAEHELEYQRRYRRMFEFEEVARFTPSLLRAGPLLTVHALGTEPPRFRRQRRFAPAAATFVSSPELLRDGPGTPLQFTYRWQYAVFKDSFRAGSHRAKLVMDPMPNEGYLHVVDRRNREVGTFDVLEPIAFELPADEKYLFRVFLAPPARLHELRVFAAPAADQASVP